MKNPFIIVTLNNGRVFRINLMLLTSYTEDKHLTQVFMADSDSPYMVDMPMAEFEKQIEDWFASGASNG